MSQNTPNSIGTRFRSFLSELVRQSGNRTERLEHTLRQTRERHGK
ncbi:hypothetical protein U0C82_05255 [Fulvimarina sp. 2208YS6-2-32]|uniref:Uncharacterized protein n=1 Tax=Fulvimarina uroteuthidis TaxID=3098149 RepID=A0ABU5I307_9HYPH|nr:hypothetical protein [Fulvimarina sp. 2208YS6-2-32]MDY8108561.1 hypothetical protein [Fulvimarina sp. 2208YS6-2-32]